MGLLRMEGESNTSEAVTLPPVALLKQSFMISYSCTITVKLQLKDKTNRKHLRKSNFFFLYYLRTVCSFKFEICENIFA